MNISNFVNDIPQQVSTLHAVIDTTEYGRNYIASVVAVGAGQAAKIGEQAGAALAVRQPRFVLVDEGKKLVASNALRVGRPIAPAIGRLDGRAKFLSPKLSLFLTLLLKVIEEFEKHNPCEQR